MSSYLHPAKPSVIITIINYPSPEVIANAERALIVALLSQNQSTRSQGRRTAP